MLKKVEPVKGVEPLTYGLRNRCSATELHRLYGIIEHEMREEIGLKKELESLLLFYLPFTAQTSDLRRLL